MGPPERVGSKALAVVRRYRLFVPEAGGPADPRSERADRRAAQALIAAYHQGQLRVLLEQVRAGFAQLDAGTIDEFDLDNLIHRYKRAAAALWSFCGSSGGRWLQAANALQSLRERGEEPNWWARSASPRDSRE